MPSYATALEQLVKARGDIFALRHLLCRIGFSSNLHHASRTDDRLLYPRIRPYISIVSSRKHVPDAKAILLSEKLGSGIRGIEKALTAGVREAVGKGVEATVALDHYHRHENCQPRLVDVMITANEAQRSFLELNSKGGFGREQLVHSCVVWAHCDMALFQMPRCTKIKPRLARELRQYSEEAQQKQAITEEGKDSISDMVLWVLVMGGIAAAFTEHRHWFQTRLRRRIKSDARLKSGMWAEFKWHVSKFLW
ncbi:uncharacterized protein Z519_06452 [Cladophialophora bantiana CBS 173.52]|uniref:Uncharacterized protein n=1 Tax=Cladophialophora bantiana (strain ATCC 10958 / CBS 173.52 / CDC B-1940 / NIH 8579) TaxID=1442370 RepID=A0A0D2HP51_CLAB1|nr:uncharacterized protein Z519_06452 [Cladophialophora bantiana CBS 173.52]KIW92605.1 hypothetical protein Z519_06452 [Cladophialophora bantiana CBS 173.52]